MAAVSRVAIFLDIDGVLCTHPNRLNQVERNRHEMKWTKVQEELESDRANRENYSQTDLSLLSSAITAGYFLDPGALQNLYAMIQKISRFAEPVIVITSSYRELCTSEDFKKRVFGNYPWLADRIIGTTAEKEGLYKLRQKKSIHPPGETPHELYRKSYNGMNINYSRGREIEGWLVQNRERFHVQNYVVLDDCCHGRFEISDLHPDNFVEINGQHLLTREMASRAVKIAGKPFKSQTSHWAEGPGDAHDGRGKV